jgi:RNA polymerase sigma-70 factor (ECF subfamily)
LSAADQESLFKRWLSVHGGIVLKVARSYTLTAADGQDLAQEISLQLWRSIEQFEGRASETTWIYRVALNTALSWRRGERRRRARQEPLLDVGDVALVEVDSGADVERRELVRQLYGAIHQLPKADAAVVLLYLDGLSYRQMAEVLGISESNVGVKLNRVKKALTELMQETAREH